MVSKDRDFRDSHLLQATPHRLLVVATGNISNVDLVRLFAENLAAVEAAFGGASLVEIRPDQLVVHDEE